MNRLIEDAGMLLRHTTVADLASVIAAESAPENAAWVMQWPAERHEAALSDPDMLHCVIQQAQNPSMVGYCLIAGLESPHNAIELRRLVIIDKGKGYGRQSLRLIKRLTFERLGAHRLWLDLFETNTKALSLYESEGFSKEGLLRDHVYRGGVYHSFIVMSILASEYYARNR